MSASKASFCFLLRVRYSECDSQSVVFNARYGEYIDVAMTEFLRGKLGGYEVLLSQGLDSQIVKQTTQWEYSAKFDDVIACYVRTLKTGNTSFVVETDMRDYFTDRRFAVSESIYVMVDRARYEKTSIPEAIKVALLREDHAMQIDHAGVNPG